MNTERILIIDGGIFGEELSVLLRNKYGEENVITSNFYSESVPLEEELTIKKLDDIVGQLGITQIYHLSALDLFHEHKTLENSWTQNVSELLPVLKVACQRNLKKVFWPSSINVFGPNEGRYNFRQDNSVEPITATGIGKRAGEHWCKYYHDEYDLDVRSIRFPMLVSPLLREQERSPNYTGEIFHQALENGFYSCCLEEDMCLPMIYLPDAAKAAFELMETAREKITVRSSYNLSGMSFAPCDIVACIKTYLQDFQVSYQPDFRHAIAAQLPASIDDRKAKIDWGWEPCFDLESMTLDILEQISEIRMLSLSRVKKQITFQEFAEGW